MLPYIMEHCIVFMNSWNVSGVFLSFSKRNITIPHLLADPSTIYLPLLPAAAHNTTYSYQPVWLRTPPTVRLFMRSVWLLLVAVGGARHWSKCGPRVRVARQQKQTTRYRLDSERYHAASTTHASTLGRPSGTHLYANDDAATCRRVGGMG